MTEDSILAEYRKTLESKTKEELIDLIIGSMKAEIEKKMEL